MICTYGLNLGILFLGKLFVLFHFALLLPKIYFFHSFDPCWNRGRQWGSGVFRRAVSRVNRNFAVEVSEEVMGYVAHRRGEQEWRGDFFVSKPKNSARCDVFERAGRIFFFRTLVM